MPLHERSMVIGADGLSKISLRYIERRVGIAFLHENGPYRQRRRSPPCPYVIDRKCAARSSQPTHAPAARFGTIPMNQPSELFLRGTCFSGYRIFKCPGVASHIHRLILIRTYVVGVFPCRAQTSTRTETGNTFEQFYYYVRRFFAHHGPRRRSVLIKHDSVLILYTGYYYRFYVIPFIGKRCKSAYHLIKRYVGRTETH